MVGLGIGHKMKNSQKKVSKKESKRCMFNCLQKKTDLMLKLSRV
jgi:hypothetical protein